MPSLPSPMAWNIHLGNYQHKLSKYLLKQYAGEYLLLDNLSLDQLTIDVIKGTGSITNVHLNVKAVNASLEKAGIPFLVIDGFIQNVTVNIPWTALVQNDMVVDVQGLEVTLRPCQVATTGDLDASWLSQSNISSTSLYIAEECMKDDSKSTTLPDGLQSFAQTIESVVTRIRATFVDTVIRLESCPPEASHGIALELRLGRVEFFDESCKDLGTSVDDDAPQADSSPFSIKNIHISKDISLYTDVFIPCHRSRSSASTEASMSSTISSDIFSSALSAHSPILRQPSYVSMSRNDDGLPHEHTTINSDPVKFLAITGEQRIKLKIKNDEKVPGPKCAIEISLSTVGILFIPKQIYLLTQLITAFTEAAESTAAATSGPTQLHLPARNKYMGSEEYGHIESNLQHQLQLGNPSSYLLSPGVLDLDSLRLGEHNLDNMSTDSGMFHSVRGQNYATSDIMTTSMYSGYSGGSTLLSNTATPSTYLYGSERTSTNTNAQKQYTGQIPSRRQKTGSLDETKSQSTTVKLNVAFIVAVLLNENTVTTPPNALDPGESDMEKLKKKSDRFMEGLSSHRSRGIVELTDLRQDVQSHCTDSHVKFLARKIEGDIKQKTMHVSRVKKSELSVDLSISYCEVTEYVKPEENIRTLTLINQQTVSEILTFSSDPVGGAPSAQPCIRVRYNNHTTQRSVDSIAQKSAIDVMICRPCSVEVDISITDRLNDLLNPTTTTSRVNTSFNTSSMSSASSPLHEREPRPSTTDLSISSECDITLYLRFPIADLTEDISQRFSWWKRNLRQEILELEVSKPMFTTKISSAPESVVEFTCRSLRAFFLMERNGDRVAFANVGQDVGDKEGLEWPRLLVKTFPVKLSSLLDEEFPDSFDSLQGACSLIEPSEPSPFSGKKAMFNDNEELKIPGSKKEISDFEYRTKSSTQLYIQLDLPAVNIVVPSKNVLELLYNRFCNDLLLWESLAPVPTALPCPMMHKLDYDMDHRLNTIHCYGAGAYSAFKRTTASSSEGELDLDQFEDDMKYSIYGDDSRSSKKRPAFGSAANPRHDGQSKSCVSINIKRGRMTLIHPSIGANEAVIPNWVPNCHGQSAIDLQDGVIYINSKSMGNPNRSYISIHSGQCTLYHDGCIPERYLHPHHVERLQSTPPSLPVVLALCSSSIPNKFGSTVGAKGDEDMLSVAIQVNLDPDPTKNIKYVVVSAALKRACLHHKFVDSAHMWVIQLQEFLALEDYDVRGYTWPKVFTDLHFHILSSAISYIPRHLPLGALVTLEKFSISSNVIADSPVTLLQFLVDDAALYVSCSEDKELLNVCSDYVCLIELNYFQLDWKSSKGNNPKYPKQDICANCSTLHIKTCADSCLALQKLIVYIADNGDLPLPANTEENPSSNVLKAKEDSEKSDTLDDSSLDGDDLALPDLMDDAMEDPMTRSIYVGAQEKQAHDPNMFLFPNETHDDPPIGSHVTPASQSDEEDSDSDGDFCKLEAPNIPTGDVPSIDYIDGDPIQIKEGFFPAPISHVNLLLPPKDFPDAVSRYCLSNLNLIWDIYGGNDFGTSKKKEGSKPRGDEKSRGGLGRDLEKLVQFQLNKVQGHWETYPDDTPKVGRRSLLIDDVEIIDMVRVSQINKLLYLYTSTNLPKQKHIGMISLKVVSNRSDMRHPKRHELDVRLSVQPIRINLDQDTLIFLEKFLSDLCDKPEITPTSTTTALSFNAADESVSFSQTPPRKRPSPTSDDPIMTRSFKTKPNKDEGRAMFDEINEEAGSDSKENADSTDESAIFIRSFAFTSDVPIRIDYVGKHIDVEHKLKGILTGLTQLNRSELRLTSIYLRRGVLGVDKLVNICLTKWKGDIATTQIPAILGGLGPLNSVVQFFHGVQDLVRLPIEQYRRDGRIVRGLQRGASSFSSSTSVALIELTTRLVQTVQGVAEISYDLVSPGTASSTKSKYRKSQPRDVREGVSNACNIVTEGFSDAASNVYNAAAKETELKGITGTVGGVVRQIVPTMLQPIIATSDAASDVLTGLRNQLDPDAHKEDMKKWKTK